MRPAVFNVSGVGNSNVYNIDLYISPSNVTLAAIVTGTVTYTVQYTFDDIFAKNFTPAGAVWVNHPSMTSQIVSVVSNLAFPATGVRITTAAGTTGSVVFTVIQAGGGGNA